MRILLLTIFMSSLCAGATSLSHIRSLYNDGQVKKSERLLVNEIKKDRKNLDLWQYLVNYFTWENRGRLAKKSALKAEKMSPPGSEYEYFFYNKRIKNRLFTGLTLTDGSLFHRNNWFIQYERNHHDNYWIYFNYERENRGSPFESSGDLFGVGHITPWTPKVYTDTYLKFSVEDSFFPYVMIGNEIFYSRDTLTLGLDINLKHYKEENVVTLSPSIRKDFDAFYVGFRPSYVIYSEGGINYAKIWAGKRFNYKHRGEISYTFGQTIFDGTTVEKFNAIDLSYKYSIKKYLDIGIGVGHYHNFTNRYDNSLNVNLLWKF